MDGPARGRCAAAALAQAAGSAAGYAHTGLLFLEPDTATLAVVDSADGSVVDVRRQPMRWANASVELANMVGWLHTLESRPDGVFVVGSGVDVAPIKPRLQMVTALPVSGPAEPEMGAVYPLLIVANHIGTGATRWPLSSLYPFVWVILLISLGALSLAGVIGAYRAKQDGRVLGELSPSGELRR